MISCCIIYIVLGSSSVSPQMHNTYDYNYMKVLNLAGVHAIILRWLSHALNFMSSLCNLLYIYITVTGFMGLAFLPTQTYIAEGLSCMNVCRSHTPTCNCPCSCHMTR